MTLQQRIALAYLVARTLAWTEGIDLQAVDLEFNDSFATFQVNGDTYAVTYEDETREIRVARMNGGADFADSGAVMFDRLLSQSDVIREVEALLR